MTRESRATWTTGVQCSTARIWVWSHRIVWSKNSTAVPTRKRFSFNDALLTALFGTPNRQNTIDRLGVVCTAFPDEEFRTAAVILRERIKKMDDFSWTALCKLSKWEINQLFDSERFLYDSEDEPGEDDDLDDEDLDDGCGE